MNRYTENQIVEFLKAIDRHVKKSAELIIIGGTAASIAYGFKRPTQDIDTANEVDANLKAAITAAILETGHNIPVSKATIYDGPYNHEDRWIEFEAAQFKKLTVKVPDPVDLILMKSLRLEEHDLAAIKAIIDSQSITADAIISRYLEEMSSAIKAQDDLDFNLMVLVDHCYGARMAAKVKSIISKKRKS
jgi:hypothetical protein